MRGSAALSLWARWAAALVTSAGALAPADARAYSEGAFFEIGQSPRNLAPKSVRATCAEGHTALGGSAIAQPEPRGLGLTAAGAETVTEARGAAQSAPVRALPRSTTGAWTLQVEVFCTNFEQRVPSESQVGRQIKAVELVKATAPASAAAAQTASVNCPAGKTVIGGGAGVQGPARTALTGLRRANAHPTGGGGLRTWARGIAFLDSPWSLTATAICANITTPSTGSDYVQVLTFQSSRGSAGSPAVDLGSASCPSGQVVIGGGAWIAGPNDRGGPPPPRQVVLSWSQPYKNDAGQGWSAAAAETSETPGTWRLMIRAVCAQIGRVNYIPGQ